MVTKTFRLSLGLLAVLAGCVGGPGEPDELAIEDADRGELGAADVAGDDTYTYFELRQDFRRCVFPLCGGMWIARVNRAQTRCADGRWGSECYVAEVDLSGLGLSDEERAAVDGDLHAGRTLIRGRVARRTIGGYAVGALVASEAWSAPGDFAASGVHVRVDDNGIRCITYPCASMHEAKLNSSLHANIAGIDFSPSGATEDQIALAYEALGTNGLLIAGDRYYERGPAGRAPARTATAFWIRVVHREAPAGDCVVTGCSGHVCAPEPVITTCEWHPTYDCYRTATCERQPDGACGWTETRELDACLAGSI